MQRARTLSIGKLAQAAGIGVETIRYYQRLGLIAVPARPAGGIRRYSANTVERLLSIRRAKELGFSLKDIAQLLELGNGECTDARQIAEQKVAGIRAKINDLQAMAASLQQLIERCDESRPSCCPILETLTNPSENSGP